MRILTIALLLAFASSLAAQKPDTIKISSFQRQQLMELKTQADEIARQQSIILQTIIASVRDPKTIGDWTVQLVENAVILTPPKKPVMADSTVKTKKP